ncbi:hypothetical protein Ciccas_005008 [Cichlidogyrus casuarinus]|uniref:Uncharacterized protein n=1 Tax=Cichlidogyrus casuarinus TaxID=1844966 RepID=A0ABD2QAS4_9PLAT
MDFVEGTNFAIWLEDYVKRSNYRGETEKTRFSKLLKAMGNGKRSQYEGILKAAEGERSPFTFAVQVLQLEADHEKERNRVRRMDFLHDNSISHAGRLQMLKLKAGKEFDRSNLVCWFKEGLEEEKSRDLEQWIIRGKNLEEIAKKLDAKYGTKNQETGTIKSIHHVCCCMSAMCLGGRTSYQVCLMLRAAKIRGGKVSRSMLTFGKEMRLAIDFDGQAQNNEEEELEELVQQTQEKIAETQNKIREQETVKPAEDVREEKLATIEEVVVRRDEVKEPLETRYKGPYKNEAPLPLKVVKEETSSSNKRPRVEDIESESDDHGEIDDDFVPDDRSLRQSDNRLKAFDLIIPAIASTQRTALALINATLDQLTRDNISPPYKPVSLTTFARICKQSGLDAAEQHLQQSQEVVCIGFDAMDHFQSLSSLKAFIYNNWRCEYEYGMSMELYDVGISRHFHKLDCRELAIFIYHLWGNVLLAIREIQHGKPPMIINPAQQKDLFVDSYTMRAIVMSTNDISARK